MTFKPSRDVSSKHWLLFLIILVYVAYHLLTLTRSPVVWLDEAGLHNLSMDFFRHGTLYQTNDPSFLNGKQILFYGPLFFVMQSFNFLLFGNDIFQYRLLPLLAGFGVLILVFLMLKGKRAKPALTDYLILLALAVDPFVNSSLHKGRMDLPSLFFLMASFYILTCPKTSRQNLSLRQVLASGLMFALAIMTTFRAGMFVIPFLIFIILLLHRKKKNIIGILFTLTLWALPVILGLLTWFLLCFSSLSGFLDYFRLVSSFHPSHMPGSLFIPVEEYFTLGIFLIMLAWLVIKTGIKTIASPEMIFLLLFIVSFYLFIGDVGPYSIFILPAVYLLIGLFQAGSPKKDINFVLLLTLLSVNLGFFLTKAGFLYLSWDLRDPHKVNEFVNQHVSPSSKIVGDDMYYYASIKNKCAYRFIYPIAAMTMHTRDYVDHLTATYPYDYLFISDRLESFGPALPNMYRDKDSLIEVARFELKPGQLPSFIKKIIPYDLSVNGYNGTLYKKLRRDTVIH
ncbi:MAG: glycosyltransferase family 39 protein [Bacteroidetes bacterium]|nr:glycosyltransferase family 39 protein [Bacteroidota bacterium]